MPLLSAKPPITVIDDSHGLFVFQDVTEDEWVYIGRKKKTGSILEKLQRRLVGHNAPDAVVEADVQDYERRFMRVSIRDGVGTMALYETDDSAETAIAYYDLREIRNVRNVVVDESMALPFITLTSEGDEPFVENVYGHIGMRIEFDSLGEAAYDRRDQKLVDSSLREVEQQSQKLQRQLERKGSASTLYVAFSSLQQRDAWATWLNEVILLRETQNLQGIGSLAAELQQEDERLRSGVVVDRVEVHAAMRAQVKKFLSVKGAGAETDPPVGGRIAARAPLDRELSQVVVAARFSAAEIRVFPHIKQSAVAAFFASDRRHQTVGNARTLRLTEKTMIQVVAPLSHDFRVLLEDGGLWTFVAKSPEARNDFVRWFRLIKGRGQSVAQSDVETFLFMQKTDAMRTEAEEQMLSAIAAATVSADEKNLQGSSSRSHRVGADEANEWSGEEDEEGDDSDGLQKVEDHTVEGEVARDRHSVLDADEKRTGREKAPTIMRRRKISVAEQTAEDEFNDHYSGWKTPPSPNGSISSCREFKYFPLHAAECPLRYIDETCQPHLVGRSFLLQTSGTVAGDAAPESSKQTPLLSAFSSKQENARTSLSSVVAKGIRSGRQSTRADGTSKRQSDANGGFSLVRDAALLSPQIPPQGRFSRASVSCGPLSSMKPLDPARQTAAARR